MSRVEGKMSRVEGKMSRVQKCRRFFLLSFIVYIFYYYFLNFFVSKNIDFVYIQALSLLSKKPEFLVVSPLHVLNSLHQFCIRLNTFIR